MPQTAIEPRPSPPAFVSEAPWTATPVRVAGLATACGGYWTESSALADVLEQLWPTLDRRLVQLLRDSPVRGRHLSRPVEELTTQLSLGDQGVRYTEAALRLATRAANAALEIAGCDAADVGALIVVSCTGFILPGLDSRLIALLGLRPNVVRTPIAQLGCAGGIAGLAHGVDWVRSAEARRALVIAVELPSLTFRPSDDSMANVLGALVFSDGAGAAVLELPSPTSSSVHSPPTLHLGRAASTVVGDTVDALGYELADDGFKVVLSRRVPALIEARLSEVVTEFMHGCAIASLDVIAAHPGGAAILEAVQRSLGAQPEQLAASWATFRAVGNSSSAAIFFVLDELARSNPTNGSRGIGVAFGPGLAIDMMELLWRE